MNCTRCEGTGFLNLDQVEDYFLKKFDDTGEEEIILNWIKANDEHDVQICDCCGDNETGWHGVRGEHFNGEENQGVYDYNGGLPECN